MVATRILVNALTQPTIEEARAFAREHVTTRGVIHEREAIDMSAKHPMVLVDGWPDGCVEETGWVELTPSTDTKNKAIELLSENFPPEEPLLESTTGFVYRADDERVFEKPCGMEVPGGRYDYEQGELASPCEECDGSLEVDEYATGFDPAKPEEVNIGDPVPTGKKVACPYCFGTGKEGTLYEAGEGPWEKCQPTDDGALEFWVINLVEEER